MDKYFEALQKSKGSIALSIADQVGYDGTADVLEKGKAAAMGEIREWNGIKYQKTPKGWMPVKQQEGASKTEPEKKEGKVTKENSEASSGLKEKNISSAEKKNQQQKESKKAFTLKDFSEDEIEEMSWDEFQKTFEKQANDFLRSLDDSAIEAIGYGHRSDGTLADYVVTHSYIPESDENLDFELQREGGKYGYALMVARGTTEETDEDGDSYWSGDGGKRLFIESETTYNSAKEAVKALQERIKAVKNGEEIEFERW